MSELIWYSFGSAAVVSVISLVGVLTFALGITRIKGVLFILVGLSVGTLFGDVLIHLVPEIFEELDGASVLPGILIMAGIIVFFALEKFLRWHHHHNCEGDLCELPRPLGYINVVSDVAHNLLDGILIGVSYLVSVPVGIATTIAIIFHEIPQEIGDFGVLLHAGFSRGKAIFFNFVSALFAILGVGIAIAVGAKSEEFVMMLLPVTAGGFLYIAGSDLVPELHKEMSLRKSAVQFLAMLVGFSIMLFIPG